ncbi:unnamed protein product [Arctogadus glacialis]
MSVFTALLPGDALGSKKRVKVTADVDNTGIDRGGQSLSVDETELRNIAPFPPVAARLRSDAKLRNQLASRLGPRAVLLHDRFRCVGSPLGPRGHSGLFNEYRRTRVGMRFTEKIRLRGISIYFLFRISGLEHFSAHRGNV